MIFDTHAHYDDQAFDEDREELLASLEANGIGAIVDVAASIDSIDPVLALAHSHDRVYAALGIHPEECGPMTDAILQDIEDKMSDPKVVAVGEIGLDYYWDTVDRQVQKKWFREQIRLAKRVHKPIIVHSRDAAQDTMDIIREENAAETGGVIHCYSYSVEMAREYVKMGFYIGLGGVVTFKNARKTKEVAQDIPLESIVLETDCPYMAPTPHRGERNSSLFLPLVVEEIARLKQITAEEVIDITCHNAERLYGLT